MHVVRVARLDVNLAVVRMHGAAARVVAPESRAVVGFAVNLALSSAPVAHQDQVEDASAAVGTFMLLLFRHGENRLVQDGRMLVGRVCMSNQVCLG